MSRQFPLRGFEPAPPRTFWSRFRPTSEEFPNNEIKTSRYNWVTFVPVNLWEQFHVVTYIFYLFISILQGTPISPVEPVAWQGLVIVMFINAFKDGWEDKQRHNSDRKVNESETMLVNQSGTLEEVQWQNVQVGTVVLLRQGDEVPADIIVLSTCDPIGGFCYIETANLDGETNLKTKSAVEITHKPLCEMNLSDAEVGAEALQFLRTVRIECEEPNRHLELFTGVLWCGDVKVPLSNQNVVYRGCTLRNTKWTYGLVMFTGMETKLMMNSVEMPLKRSTLQKSTQSYTIVVLIILIGLCFVSMIMLVTWLLANDPLPWYLDDLPKWYYEVWAQPLAALCVYCWVIPLFLNVDMQIVKLVHIIFINNDSAMVHTDPKTGITMHAKVQSSGLVEDMGQIQYVFSDKTGTLTQNVMEFLKCSIAGVTYGSGTSPTARFTPAEQGYAPVLSPFGAASGSPRGSRLSSRRNQTEPPPSPTPGSPVSPTFGAPSAFIPTGVFFDPRLSHGMWRQRTHAEEIRRFFLALALCHTVIAQPLDGDEFDPLAWRPDNIMYQASSPDEEALVIGARSVGFTFLRRSYKEVSICLDGEEGVLKYEVLNLNEFSSVRKRMSIVVRDPGGGLRILCKGADSAMLELLSLKGQAGAGKVRKHVDQFAKEGLRTLVLGEREVSAGEYEKWAIRHAEASLAQVNREERLEGLAIELERDFELLGATGSEDKLQDGVPECIRNLRLAGIQVWVLTGDKVDTAVTIATSCNLLNSSMHITRITSPDPPALNTEADKQRWIQDGREHVRQMFQEANAQVFLDERDEALVIDGVSLARVMELEEECKMEDGPLLEFCCRPKCRVVCACRVSPKQKAEVVLLVKTKKQKITLAIGDGANDVSMIKEAHIGIGINGKEGAQAAMASDLAIPQFRFLEQLLLVHGRWAFQRLSIQILYSYARSIGWTLVSFYFSADAAFSSGQYWDDFFAGQWNSFFTSVASYAVCFTNRDFHYQSSLLAMPQLYGDVQSGHPFRPARFCGWMLHSIYTGIACYYLSMYALVSITRSDGLDNGFWLTSYTAFAAMVVAVNLRLLLEVQSLNRWIAAGFIFSFFAYWIFGALYTSIPPVFEFLFLKPAIVYWMFYVQVVDWGTWATILLCVLVGVAPLILVKAWKAVINPMTLTEAAQRREHKLAKEQASLDRQLAEDEWYRLLVLQKQREDSITASNTPANTEQ